MEPRPQLCESSYSSAKPSHRPASIGSGVAHRALEEDVEMTSYAMPYYSKIICVASLFSVFKHLIAMYGPLTCVGPIIGAGSVSRGGPRIARLYSKVVQ